MIHSEFSKLWQKYFLVARIILVYISISSFVSAQNNITINSTTQGNQDSPEIAVNNKGVTLVMYESTVSGDHDENILAVSYDRKTFKEFYHTGKTTDTPSLEAIPNTNNFVVSWEQNSVLYYSIVSCNNGNEIFIVEPRPIRDDTTITGKRPDIAIAGDGSIFVIGWQQYDYDDVDLHFFDNTGTPIGNVVKISEVLKRRSQIGLKFRSDSVLVATWHTRFGENEEDIWFQLFDCKPVWEGSAPIKYFEYELKANGDLSIPSYSVYKQEYPEVDVFKDNRFAIMWQDFPYSDGGDGSDGNGKGAYFRIFNSDGTPQTNDIQISEHTRSFQKDADMRIRQSDNTIHFVYEDAYESTLEKDWLAYPSYRVFNDLGEPIGPSIELTNKGYGTDCRLAITEADAEEPNLVLFVWETKDIENYDGSGRAVVFSDSATITTNIAPFASINNAIPEGFELYQNYPNPFNPSTTIRFKLESNSFVNLNIYNVLGENVVTLLDENKNAGIYTLKWRAENIKSGIYYIKLTTAYGSKIKKCILLK